ncbi:MAG: hypothetical protein HY264_08495 [Chloroflexi bacterium]|nr:hypothetical protein [Chloroflexota bacterium]
MARPVSATTTKGDFTLTISSPKDRYATDEAIDVLASLAYGPAGAVGIAHGLGADDGPLSFSVDEPIMGDLHLGGGIRTACRVSTLAHDTPIEARFTKGGAFDGADPLASPFMAYLSDPVLRLPPGTWHLRVNAGFALGSCGDDRRFDMSAAITIVVDGPASTATETQPAGSQVPTGSRVPATVERTFPGVCPEIGVSLNQCAGFAAWAIGQAGLEPGRIQRIEMTRVNCPGGSACPTASTGSLVNVHLTTDRSEIADEIADEVVNCTRRDGSLGGINFLCDEMMTGDGRVIQYPLVRSAISGGYRDTPCSGEGPIGCATALPTIEPSALAGSQPLSIESREIPIDHAGPYSVVLGQASLPNGILSAASAEITSSPTNPLVAYDGYRLMVTSLDGGPPFDGYYQHGWRPGTERVEVTLSFVVLMLEPGASVVVSSVDVH